MTPAGGGGGVGVGRRNGGGGGVKKRTTLWHKVAPPLLDQAVVEEEKGGTVTIPSPTRSSGIDVRRHYRSSERRETINDDLLAKQLQYDPYYGKNQNNNNNNNNQNQNNINPAKMRYHKSQNQPFTPPRLVIGGVGGVRSSGLREQQSPQITESTLTASELSQDEEEEEEEEEEPARTLPKKQRQQSTTRTNTRRAYAPDPDLPPVSPKNRRKQTMKPKKRMNTKKKNMNRGYDGTDSSRTEETVRGCVRGTFTIGRQVTECLLTTADLYQQECYPHQKRGDDSMFLVFDRQTSSPGGRRRRRRRRDVGINPYPLSFDTGEDNSMTLNDDDDDSNSDDDDDDDDTASTLDDDDVICPPAIVNVSRQIPIEEKQEGHEQNPPCLAPVAPPGTAMTDSNPFVHTIAASSDIEPPNNNQPMTAPDDELRVGVEEGGICGAPCDRLKSATEDLRELRLDMFRSDLDMTSGKVVPQTKYKRAVQQLSNQTQNLEQLRRELAAAQDALSKTRNDLDSCKQEAVNQQQANALSSEKLFRGRVQIEERLRNELKQKQVLQSEKALLEKELSLLKHSVKNAKLQEARRSLSPPHRLRTYAETATTNNANTPDSQESLSNNNVTTVSSEKHTADTNTENSRLTTKSPQLSEQIPPFAEEKQSVDVALSKIVSSSRTSTPDEPAVTSIPEAVDSKDSNTDSEDEDELVVVVSSNEGSSSSSSSGNGEEMEYRQDSDAEAARSSLSSPTMVISLRAELTMIKAQLAEAKAALLSLEQAKADAEAHARADSAASSKQVSHLKQQVLTLQTISDEEADKHKREKEELEGGIEQLTKKLEESESTAQLHSESNEKLKAELKEAQQEAAKLREQVKEFYQYQQQDIQEKQQEREQSVSYVETKKLQQDLRTVQAELARTNAEIVAQASEHLKERQRLEDQIRLARQQHRSSQEELFLGPLSMPPPATATTGPRRSSSSSRGEDPQPDDEEEEKKVEEEAGSEEDNNNNTMNPGMEFLRGVLSRRSM